MACSAVCEHRCSGGGDDAAGRQRHTEESAVRIDDITEAERVREGERKTEREELRCVSEVMPTLASQAPLTALFCSASTLRGLPLYK